MELDVEIDEASGRGALGLHFLERRHYPIQRSLAVHTPLDGGRLQREASVKQVAKVGRPKADDDGSAVGERGHQPFSLEHLQGVANRTTRDGKLMREPDLG